MRPMRRRGFRPVLPGLQGAAAWLAVALIVGSVVFALTRQGFGALLLLFPGAVLRGLVWQPLTYAFLHGDAWHLFFNMLGLWMFGSELEALWGGKRYAQLLVASALTAAAAQLVFTLLIGGRAASDRAALRDLATIEVLSESWKARTHALLAEHPESRVDKEVRERSAIFD